jgi:hypothetical protein
MSRFKSRRGDAALPSRIVQAAIAKLPRPVQAQVLAALHEEGEPRSHAPVPDTPPYVFVVKAGKTLTFHAIREIAWARPDLLGVTFDRRWMGDRRLQERPGHVERRRAQRRSSALDSTWVQRGFVLSITPAPGVARLGRTVDDRHPAVEAAAPADTRPSSSYGEPAALNVTGAPSDPADMEPASNPAGGAERGFLAPQSPDLARSDAVRVSDPTPADTVTPVPSPPSFAAEGAVPVDEPVSAAAVAADDAAPPEGPARPPASATLEPGGEPAPPRLPEPQPAVTTELLPLDATPPCAAGADQ